MSKRMQVVRVIQSPMNKKRWLATLACGHEQWMTRSRRPNIIGEKQVLSLTCDECPDKTELDELVSMVNEGPVVCDLTTGITRKL